LVNKHLTAVTAAGVNPKKADQNHSDSSNSIIRQGSNDSNYSGPSSGGDLSLEENEKHHVNRSSSAGQRHRTTAAANFAASPSRQKPLNKQQQALDAKREIELCRTKPVLFAVRTNVSYEPSKEHGAPVPLDMIVGFDVRFELVA